MKKTLLLTVVLMCLPGLVAGQARWRKKSDRNYDYHFLYVSGGVGYSSLTAPKVQGTLQGDLGAIGGLGYEFREGGFWLSVGGQISLQRSAIKLDPYTFGSLTPGEGVQLLGKIPYGNGSTRDVLLQYQIEQTDRNQLLMAEVPIMLGMYKYGFYVGAGVKVGFSLQSTLTATADYGIKCKFPEYIDTPPFDHSDQIYGYQNKLAANFRPQVAIIGEVGYDVLSSITTRSLFCHVLKVGFYWEVGVTSMRQKDITYLEQNMVMQNPTTKQREIVINPYLMSKIPDGNASKEFVAPFLTGIKLTYMFGGSQHGSRGTMHKGCQCYNN